MLFSNNHWPTTGESIYGAKFEDENFNLKRKHREWCCRAVWYLRSWTKCFLLWNCVGFYRWRSNVFVHGQCWPKHQWICKFTGFCFSLLSLLLIVNLSFDPNTTFSLRSPLYLQQCKCYSLCLSWGLLLLFMLIQTLLTPGYFLKSSLLPSRRLGWMWVLDSLLLWLWAWVETLQVLIHISFFTGPSRCFWKSDWRRWHCQKGRGARNFFWHSQSKDYCCWLWWIEVIKVTGHGS